MLSRVLWESLSAGRVRTPDFQGALLGIFQRPTYATQAPGDPQHVFVVEQPGRVMLLRDGVPLDTPFLDIQDEVLSSLDPGAGAEEGMLSIAFPPDYQQSGRFYVYFTNNDQAIEVDEFHVSSTDPEVADPTTRRPVIVIPHSAMAASTLTSPAASGVSS